MAQTDLTRITLHGLRRTHATLLPKAGGPVKVVSERLGHADPGLTLRQYAHVLGSMQAEAAQMITAMIDGETPSRTAENVAGTSPQGAALDESLATSDRPPFDERIQSGLLGDTA